MARRAHIYKVCAAAGRSSKTRANRIDTPRRGNENTRLVFRGGVPKRPTGADCKSAGLRLRRFESYPLHQLTPRASPPQRPARGSQRQVAAAQVGRPGQEGQGRTVSLRRPAAERAAVRETRKDFSLDVNSRASRRSRAQRHARSGESAASTMAGSGQRRGWFEGGVGSKAGLVQRRV